MYYVAVCEIAQYIVNPYLIVHEYVRHYSAHFPGMIWHLPGAHTDISFVSHHCEMTGIISWHHREKSESTLVDVSVFFQERFYLFPFPPECIMDAFTVGSH